MSYDLGKFEHVQKSLPMWNFEENSQFVGIYIETDTITPDDIAKDPFELHVFKNVENSEDTYVSSYHAVDKAIKAGKEKFNGKPFACDLLFIEKTEVKGKPFRRFATSIAPLLEIVEKSKKK